MALLIAKLSITHGGVVPELWRTCGGIVAFFYACFIFLSLQFMFIRYKSVEMVENRSKMGLPIS